MKEVIINPILKKININKKYSNQKMAEIKYGLEVLYLTITKTVVILTISYILGIIKELLLILLFYGLLRLTGYGLHAKKSYQCWISSLLVFLLMPYIIIKLKLNMTVKIIISIISIILIFIFAPSDTEKRPLIHKNKRLKLKIICTITAIILLITMIYIKNNLIENAILVSLIIENIMINPITYKIFRLSYANYKKYKPKQNLV